MDDFSFRRDLKHVDWQKTLQLNALRAAAAGLIVGCLPGIGLLFVGEGGERAAGLLFPVLYAVMLPIGLPIYFAIAVVCGKLADLGVPFVGWISLLFAIVFAFGDPLLFFLHRSRPDLVPVETPRFMNLRLVLFVLDPLKVRATHVMA